METLETYREWTCGYKFRWIVALEMLKRLGVSFADFSKYLEEYVGKEEYKVLVGRRNDDHIQ